MASPENATVLGDLGKDEKTSPRLLTLKRAAAFLGLTVWAIRERIWAGHIPVIQYPGGRKQYVDTLDLESFIAAHKRVIR
jgi:hypothetical protein